jgi:ribose transport system substrate-binding protein
MSNGTRSLLTPVVLAAMLTTTVSVSAADAIATSSDWDRARLACDRKIPVQDLIGAPKATKPYKIEISVSTLANPYITALLYGASLAATDSGVKISIDSGAGIMDAAAQIRQIENAMSRHPDALLVQSADPDALVRAVDDIIDGGTPVVETGALTSSTKSLKVAQDDYEVGVSAAKTLLKLLPNGGEGIAQGGPANALWARRQVAGFLDTVKNASAIKVNAVTNEDLVPTVGLQKFTDAHAKVEWINVTNYVALSPYSIPPEFKSAVYIAGSFDSVMKKAVKEGIAKAAMPYFPSMVGYFGVATAVEKLNGGAAARVTCIPTAAITSDVVDDPMWQRTNYPPDGWQPLTR